MYSIQKGLWVGILLPVANTNHIPTVTSLVWFCVTNQSSMCLFESESFPYMQ